MRANLFIVRKLGYLVATLAILFACIMLATMLANVYLKEHQKDFEAWASELLRTPVHISSAEIAWHHFQPGLDLNEVSFLNQESQKPILQIKKIIIHLSIFKSIMALSPVPSGMSIKGTEVNLFQSAQGNISVHGFPALTGFNAELNTQPTSLEKILAFISIQPRITLQNIDVRYISSHGQKFYLSLFKLKLRNQDDRHAISGKAILHQQVPTEVQMAINWQGNELDVNKIKAESYFYISGVSLLQWLEGRTWHGFEIKKGIGSAKVWANWQNGKWQTLQMIAQLYDLNFYSVANNRLHRVNRISGNFGLRREDNGDLKWVASDVVVDLPHRLWPLTSFEYIVSQVGDPKYLSFGFLPLNDVKTLLLDSSLLSSSQQKLLKALSPEGILRNTQIVIQEKDFKDLQQIRFSTETLDFGLQRFQDFPSIQHFSGKFYWDGKQGQVDINSKGLIFYSQNQFSKPVKLDEVIGKIVLHSQNNKFDQLAIPGLTIKNADLNLTAKGVVNLPDSFSLADPINLDLNKIRINLAFFAPWINPNHLVNYLPNRVMNADLVAWIKNAFLNGQVNNMRAILHGELAEFPFDQGNGHFSMEADLKNIELQYAYDWPHLKILQGQLAFVGRSFDVSAEQADLVGMRLKNISANIANLSEQTLKVTVGSDTIQTDFDHAIRFIQQSPLAKTVGVAFNKMQLMGPLAMNLDLTVPLNYPANTAVQGTLLLQNDVLKFKHVALSADKLNGKITLTENGITAKDITGELLGKPMLLQLDRLDKPGAMRAVIKNHLTLKDLELWLNVPLQPYAQGEADFNTHIDFIPNEPLLVHLNSNLIGVTIDWNKIFTKEANKAQNLNLELLLQEDKPLQLKLAYENDLKAALAFLSKNKGYELLAANLHLGTGEANLPEKGIMITGNFDQLDWSDIKRFINQSQGSQLSNIKLNGIDISTKKFQVGSSYLNQIRLQVKPQQDDWEVKFTGKDAVGHLVASQDLNSQGYLNAEFERLILRAGTSKESDSLGELTNLPAVNFQANHVNYHDIPLGRIVLKAIPAQDGLVIKKLQVGARYLSLNAVGSWRKTVTKLQGNASSENVSELLSSFGLEAQNFISSKGQLKFNLNWNGTPFIPELDSLNGKASLNLGPGRIVDVGEASGAKMDLGKLLSIFSLQAIPRRLTLDFRDVFQKGYSFDALDADFNLDKGNAYTNNMRFSGPVASVNIKGRMGFGEKDLDLFLNVVPHIAASSLPVAATLLGVTPVVGLAALAVGTVIGSSQAVSMNYTVDGPWSDPVWRSGNEQSKKI